MFVEKLEKRFNLSHPIIVADAGLLSKKNKKPGITIYRAKFLAESLYDIEYVNPYNGKKMSVMLRTEYDEEVTKLLEAIGMKP